MTHASIVKEERERLGITDSLIRLSCGVEETIDLLQDIYQALEKSVRPTLLLCVVCIGVVLLCVVCVVLSPF